MIVDLNKSLYRLYVFSKELKKFKYPLNTFRQLFIKSFSILYKYPLKRRHIIRILFNNTLRCPISSVNESFFKEPLQETLFGNSNFPEK